MRECKYHQAQSTDWQGKHDYLTQKFDTLINKHNQVVTEQVVAKVANDKIIKEMSVKLFDLEKKNEKLIKSVQTLVSTKQKVVVQDRISYFDTTFAAETPSVPIYNDSLVPRDQVIIPPQKFDIQDEHFSLAGIVKKDAIVIDSLSFNNTITWRIAEKKRNIFSKRETVVQSINSNPYFSTVEMNSITVKHKTNAWNKWIKPALTFGAGVFISSKL